MFCILPACESFKSAAAAGRKQLPFPISAKRNEGDHLWAGDTTRGRPYRVQNAVPSHRGHEARQQPGAPNGFVSLLSRPARPRRYIIICMRPSYVPNGASVVALLGRRRSRPTQRHAGTVAHISAIWSWRMTMDRCDALLLLRNRVEVAIRITSNRLAASP